MQRLNITIPDEIALKLKKQKNKSRFIAEALKEKFETEKKKQLELLMIEGYKATVKEDRQIYNDWENTDTEKWD